MDPDALLAELRSLANELLDAESNGNSYGLSDEERAANEDRGSELAQKVLDLDEWIRRGGFLPSSWQPRAAA